MKTGTLRPVSNAATWTDTYQFLDSDDGTPFDLAGVTAITLRIRCGSSDEIAGSLNGGEIVIVGDDEDGTIQWTFSAGAMSALEPKTYRVSLLVSTDDETSQIILGHLPVIEGF